VKERKYIIILVSLIFAFFVWTSVNLGNQFQISIDVPVKIEHLRADQAIAIPLPKDVRCTVQGTGWQLLNTIFSPSLRYTIDFKQLLKKDTLFTYKELNEHTNISSSIHIIDTFPETVLVRLDLKTTKTVPVLPIVNASFRDGFGIVGRVKTNPDSIVLTGARSLLNKISYWKTTSITLNDINAPIKTIAALADSLAFEISQSHSTVSVSFDVQPIAEKSISDISIEIVQVPENKKIVLIPPKISIIVRSGVNNIAPLSGKDFTAFIDYKSILLDTSGMISPSIVGPDDVKIVQLNPNKIQYVMRK
jgi:YbbR domain-containing protein